MNELPPAKLHMVCAVACLGSGCGDLSSTGRSHNHLHLISIQEDCGCGRRLGPLPWLHVVGDGGQEVGWIISGRNSKVVHFVVENHTTRL